MIEFEAWPKIARLNRDIIITEKIDGTNAAIVVDDEGNIGAQSRTRLLTLSQDNHGFCKWVYSNADDLAEILGPGRHYGEWWGSGIQRGYGCNPGERYFSLFNTKRWDPVYDEDKWPVELSIVPIMYQGAFSEFAVQECLQELRENGSVARSPFHKPEGIVIYHTAANQMFKVTLENDEAPKSLAA